MEGLCWLDRLLKAFQERYQEVLHEKTTSGEGKATKLSNLRTAVSRLRGVQSRAKETGLTPELKNQIVQAVIEADSGGSFGD